MSTFQDFVDVQKYMLENCKEPEKPLYLCRKIRFGNNGNLIRYEPVKFPAGTEFVNANVKYNDKPQQYKILGRNVDVSA